MDATPEPPAHDPGVAEHAPAEPWVGLQLLPRSRKGLLAAGVATAFLAVVGLVGISPLLHAGPFAPSVSERVSKAIDRPVSCSNVGEADLVGRTSAVYRCESTDGMSAAAGCYSLVNDRVYPVYGIRKLGC